MSDDLNRQRRAERSVAVMWEKDAAAKLLGMTLEAVGPGRACVAMKVSAIHANGHGTCHGGMIFALAGTAFAMACNSDNKATVAQNATITYLRPALIGDVLLAEAAAKASAGRSAIYDVSIRNQNGEDVAAFRGESREIGGAHFSESVVV